MVQARLDEFILQRFEHILLRYELLNRQLFNRDPTVVVSLINSEEKPNVDENARSEVLESK